MSRIGEKIREKRIQKGFSTKQLARKCGVSPNFIEDIEAGKRIISENLLKQLSKILGEDLNLQMENMEEEEKGDPDRENIFEKAVEKIPAKREEPLDQWAEALAGIVRKIPVYADLEMEKIAGHKSFPVINGKVEGMQPEKLVYVMLPDDLMKGFRMHRGDRALIYFNTEWANDSFVLVEVDGSRKIRKIKREGSNQVQLISCYKEQKAVVKPVKELKVLGKMVRIEIDF
ncbi:MAG TPA: helix-turn-helix transcriptional regulator [Clostridiales bacterium]|nr:helix-turn-helix transcriptional regulator [Clostridiales bacterium]